MRFRTSGDKYWPHLEKKLKESGLELRLKDTDFETRNFQPKVGLEGEENEVTLVLTYRPVADWVDGNDGASEAKIDAAIREVLRNLKGN